MCDESGPMTRRAWLRACADLMNWLMEGAEAGVGLVAACGEAVRR